MPHHVLTQGTVLDDRYRIDAVLGEGGFGITYAAVNLRIDQKVAVKELFWRGHSARDCMVSPEVALTHADDLPAFNEQKARFLREARTVRDFSDLPGIAHILDYFEANATAYIVMEYVEGETLSQHIKKQGRLPAEPLLRRALPLIRSLGRIHDSGCIHRDISPDNLIVTPDETLKLIDFGAAREFRSPDPKYTTITKDCFAPGEQYDKNGHQGPWTDVYALCATLYACVAGTPPENAVQRMFLDELKAPSELGVEIDPKYEAILMRGLQMNPAKRYSTMVELAQAIQSALPQEKPKRRAGFWIAAAVVAACLIAAACFFAYNAAKPADKFRNVTTETFRLIAPSEVTAREFAQTQADVEALLNDFAGADNYEITAQDARFSVRLPLDVFQERDIGAVLDEALKPILEEKKYSLQYQIQVDWEDPTTSSIAGEHQIRPSEFTGITAIFSYRPGEDISKGQRANLIVDMKTRLDALETPYAFGTAYGSENEFIVRLDPVRIGRFVVNTLAETYPLKISGAIGNSVTVNGGSAEFTLEEDADSAFCLRFRTESDIYGKELEKLSRALLKYGESTLYLADDRNEAIAEARIDAPITDGAVEFQDFRINEVAPLDADHRYIVEYLLALINDTSLPTFCTQVGEGIWSAEGDLLFDVNVDDYFGWTLPLQAQEARMIELLKRIRDEQGCEIGVNGNTYFLSLNFPQDGRLMENIRATLPMLLENYEIGRTLSGNSLLIPLIDEHTGEYFRIALHSTYDSNQGERYCYVDYLLSEEGRLAPYAEEFKAWYAAFPWEDYGFEREFRW